MCDQTLMQHTGGWDVIIRFIHTTKCLKKCANMTLRDVKCTQIKQRYINSDKRMNVQYCTQACLYLHD